MAKINTEKANETGKSGKTAEASKTLALTNLTRVAESPQGGSGTQDPGERFNASTFENVSGAFKKA